MPSVTDVQQQQQQPSNNSGKSTPPPPTTTTDSTNADPLSQAILLLDKKQRNLGKRKVISNLKQFLSNFQFFIFRKSWKVIERKQRKEKN
jgi:hypothetical protein